MSGNYYQMAICIRPLQSQISCKMMKREWIWFVLAKATSWQCRFDKILNCISVFRRKVALTSKKQEEKHTYSELPWKSSFAWTSYTHVLVIVELQSSRVNAHLVAHRASVIQHPRLMLPGYFAEHWRNSFYWKLEIPPKNQLVQNEKNRQIIVAHHPSFRRT